LKSQQNSPQRRKGEGWHKIPKLEKVECLKCQQNSTRGETERVDTKFPKLEEIECLKSQQSSQWRRIGRVFLGMAISPGQK
jgi:hypothetical protein